MIRNNTVWVHDTSKTRWRIKTRFYIFSWNLRSDNYEKNLDTRRETHKYKGNAVGF